MKILLTKEESNKIKQDELLMEIFNREIENFHISGKQKILKQYLHDLESIKLEFKEETLSEDFLENSSETTIETLGERSIRNMMNAESSNTRNTAESVYPRTAPETMGYSIGHPPRLAVNAYTNNNPNSRTLGIQSPHEVKIVNTETLMLNITQVHPQLLDT